MIVLLPHSFSFLPHILSPYSYKLNRPLAACLTIEVEENCESIEGTWPFPDFEYEINIFLAFEHCLRHYWINENPIIFYIIKHFINENCLPKLKIRAILS